MLLGGAAVHIAGSSLLHPGDARYEAGAHLRCYPRKRLHLRHVATRRGVDSGAFLMVFRTLR